MVTLPPEFIATKYAGYFWNITTHKLYTLKNGGVLRELKGPCKGGSFGGKTWEPGYKVCNYGFRRTLTMRYLTSLKPHNSVIPVAKS